ncbi:metallophosphoesterase family protein [Geodermatophilus ruber]|uniref:Predicted phosphoesterase n=1 Tax=Geodermatophilus ruber TaxID=504800 RepID=A0A1I4C0B2_9ACTN|nr:metallophosphoesterase [Geodermatophilus ruber]SFK74375.1 Predicted phosphoesterase [Geodermatophilus ruber]
MSTAVESPLAMPAGGRVLVVGDVHGSEPHLLRLVQGAAEAGLSTIVQLGDTFGTHPARSARAMDAVSCACVEHGVTFLWLDGNHDRHVGLLDRLPTDPVTGLHPCRPHVWHLPRGASWTWGGCRWTAVGGAVSVDAAVRTYGEDWWIEEELTDADIDRVVAEVGATDVLLSHDRPAWVEPALGQAPGAWWRHMPFRWSEDDFRRSQAHQRRLDRLVTALRPKLHMHGHLHRRYDLVTDESPWGGRTRVSGLAHEPMQGNTLVVPCAPDFDRLLADTGTQGDAW